MFHIKTLIIIMIIILIIIIIINLSIFLPRGGRAAVIPWRLDSQNPSPWELDRRLKQGLEIRYFLCKFLIRFYNKFDGQPKGILTPHICLWVDNCKCRSMVQSQGAYL